MDSIERLHRKAQKAGARFVLRFDPTQSPEAMWAIRYYPDPDENANFWSEGTSMDSTVRQLLDELEGFR